MEIFRDRAFSNEQDKYLFDLICVDGPLISTVEFKRSPKGIYADTWTSARFGENELCLVLRIQIPLVGVAGEDKAGDLYEGLYSRSVKPLALKSLELGGLPDSINPPDPSTRRKLAWAHLKLHADAGHIPYEKSPVAVRTALEYKLIKSFGFHAATPLMAQFEGINAVALDQRLHLAREAKLLEKVSVVGRKNSSIELEAN
jgi:hypothetical protein